MVLPDFCVRAEAFCHLPGLRTSAAHTDGQAINPRLGYRLEGARHIVTYRQQGPSNFSLMAAEEVPRVVGFACLQAMAPAAARPSRDEQPVSPLAALLARQGQAFRRPLVVRTRRPEVDGAFRARSLQLEIRGEVGPDHGSSASAPSSVSTPAIAIPETARRAARPGRGGRPALLAKAPQTPIVLARQISCRTCLLFSLGCDL